MRARVASQRGGFGAMRQGDDLVASMNPRAAVTSFDPRDDRRAQRDDKKRARNKSRAERMFNKQFAGSDAPAGGEGGPRAAVYTGRMGSEQRKASRMHEKASTLIGLAAAFVPRLGARGDRNRSDGKSGSVLAGLLNQKLVVSVMAVLVCMVFAGAFLYPSAREYYIALRNHDQLQAEYVAVESRNASLASHVASLSTESGIKQEAHEQLGWVEEGWESGRVVGLDRPHEVEMNVDANIVAGSIPAPRTWYSDFLDTFFGLA